jgi:hypothetical protein
VNCSRSEKQLDDDMLQRQKRPSDNYCIEGRRRKPLSKRDRESTFSNGVPVWGSDGLSTQTGRITAKGPARKKETHTVHARRRAWMHDGGQRSWVPACSGAAVGPAMIRREEYLALCEVRQALVCGANWTPLECSHTRPVTRLDISCIA